MIRFVVAESIPVPIPDFGFLTADEAPDRLVAILGLSAAVCFAVAIVGTVWSVLGEPPLRFSLATILLIVVGMALSFSGIKRYEADQARMEEAGPVTLGRYWAVQDRIGAMLEEYYGIEFYRTPTIPQRGDEPQFGLVNTPDGVKLCWVHAVEAEDRLTVSCGTHDAATSTELPAVG